MHVEIDGVSVESIVANGVSPHDETRNSRRFKGRDDLGEPDIGIHNNESSRLRLPRTRSSVKRG
jgi:hypothetical protein